MVGAQCMLCTMPVWGACVLSCTSSCGKPGIERPDDVCAEPEHTWATRACQSFAAASTVTRRSPIASASSR